MKELEQALAAAAMIAGYEAMSDNPTRKEEQMDYLNDLIKRDIERRRLLERYSTLLDVRHVISQQVESLGYEETMKRFAPVEDYLKAEIAHIKNELDG